jgi:hypothetical protein
MQLNSTYKFIFNVWYSIISFFRINSIITWCLVAPLHICKSLHGCLVKRQGTMFTILTNCHLVTNVKNLWMSGRASDFCGFEGAIWDIYSSLLSGQSHRPTWCILTFSFYRGNFCLLLIINYSYWFNLSGVLTFSLTCMACFKGRIWRELYLKSLGPLNL